MSKNLEILVYDHPTDEIRRKTRQYMREIRPNVFTGVLYSGVIEHLWKEIEASGTDATLIRPDKNEQGFSVKSTSADSKHFADFYGIMLTAQKKAVLTINNVYAKPEKKLWDHLYETGIIAEVLLKYGRAKHAVEEWAKLFNISVEKLINLICFLCAAHDIGKCGPGFLYGLAQKSSGEIVDAVCRLLETGMILPEDEYYRHERYTREIEERYFDKYHFTTSMYRIAGPAYAAVAVYHHQGKEMGFEGQKVYEPIRRYKPDDARWTEWEALQDQILRQLEVRWPVKEDTETLVRKPGIDGFLYFILSVMIISDWIASGAMWDAHIKSNGLSEQSVLNFLERNGLLYQSIESLFHTVTWNQIFNFQPNELQKLIASFDDGYSDLTLIEYPCGYGKTEAALLAALKTGGKCGGIYFGAPTTATARGLALRLREIAKKTGQDILVPEFDGSGIWNESEMDTIPKDMWTSRSRHRILYPYAAGTVDQILKCISEYRYGCIGITGMSDKVVIIDEVHAYDSYMQEEIENIIKWCRVTKAPVILLSATLPTKTKKKLFAAANWDKKDEISKAYPLVSVIKDKKLVQHHIKIPGRSRKIKCLKTNDMLEDMLKYAENLNTGCLALIVPTVTESFVLKDMITAKIKDCPVILYQGRGTEKQKEDHNKEMLKLFGKDRSNRPEKAIVIATSIIEQSLDIDMDYIVTALAPIDLLIQRMGRQLRHDDKGTIREHQQIDDTFIILIPESRGGLSYIYEKNILDRTEAALENITHIDTVEDIRALVDYVYDVELEKETVQALKAANRCIGSPFGKTPNIIKLSEDAYRKFDALAPVTREESYPTVPVCILKEIKDNYSYEEIRDIKYGSVVNNVGIFNIMKPGDKKTEKKDEWYFTGYRTDIEGLEGIYVFESPNLEVIGNGRYMKLTGDGLDIRKNQ